MKTKINLALCLFMLWATSLFAQQSLNSTPILQPADSLQVALNKTTSLVFPFPIRSVDRGSQGLLVQKARGAENTLQVKAAYECFPETSLTVITSDGRLYCFIFSYNENPAALNYTYGGSAQSKALPASGWPGNEESLDAYCALALGENEVLHGVKDKKNAISFCLSGLFIKDDVLFCRIVIKNDSNINYDIDQLRFFIRDRKKAKRTASQEIELQPLYVKDRVAVVGANSEQTIVYALPKFTIPEKKYLAIQVVEQDGGRNLDLKLKSAKLAKVSMLPSLY